jgi:hypothetical protein
VSEKTGAADSVAVATGRPIITRAQTPNVQANNRCVALMAAPSIQDFAQISHVLGERAAPGRRRLDARLRFLADEELLDGDVAGLLQRLEMGAIAVGGADQPFEAGEFELRVRRQHAERGHDLEAHRLADDFVRRS